MLSYFVEQLVGELISRICEQSDKTDGCTKFSKSNRAKRSGQPDTTGGSGNIGSGEWKLPNFKIPDFPDFEIPGFPEGGLPNIPGWSYNFSGMPLPDGPDNGNGGFLYNGTACFCASDMCNGDVISLIGNGNGNSNGNGNGKTGNETGGSAPQNSDSPYFTVVCVIAMVILMTLSAANNDEL